LRGVSDDDDDDGQSAFGAVIAVYARAAIRTVDYAGRWRTAAFTVFVRGWPPARARRWLGRISLLAYPAPSDLTMPGPPEQLAPTEPMQLTPGRGTSGTEPTMSSSAALGTEPTLRFDDEHGAIDPGVADSERYVFGEAFAAGGIGVVRRGSDRRLGRVIAIKELLHDSPRAQQRFALEAAITARLQHPGIVPLYDLGWQGSGKPYYCMKLVDGESLEAKIDQTKDLGQRLRLLEHVIAVADAIAYAHEQQVLHRDLKPANVLVGRFGETVVIDWGLAKDLSGRLASESPMPFDGAALRDAENMTEAGAVMGTLRYMPPEQASGQTVDARSDVYALGAVLYHVLTGQPPFAAVRRSVLIARVIDGAWDEVRAVEPAVPRELAAIAQRAMARDPAVRYPSAAAFAEDLRRFLAGRLVSAHAYSFREVVLLWLRRYRLAVAVAAVLLLALLVMGVLAAWRIDQERQAAVLERNNAVVAGEKAASERDAAEAARTLAQEARTAAEDALAGEKTARDQAARAADEAIEQKRLADVQRVVAVESAGAAQAAERRATTALAGQQKATHEAELQRGQAEASLVRAEDEARRARDANRLAVALKVLAQDPTTALALLHEVEDPLHTRGWTPAAVEALQRPASTSVIRGHDSSVIAAVFAADGGSIVTAGHDGTGRVTPLAGGAVTELRGHTERLVALAISPVGERVATASADGTARLWDRAGAAVVLRGHTGPLTAVTFSRDGTRVATGSRDRSVLVWDALRPGDPVRLAGHTGAVRSIEFSGDGERLVSSSDDGTACVWSIADAQVQVLAGHAGTVYSAALSPDGARVVTAGDDGTVRVWHLGEAAAERLLGHTDAVYAAEFSPDGKRVASASRDRTARVWTLGAAGKATSTALRGHRDKVYAAHFDPTGRTIATVSRDGTARLWAVAGGESRELRGHTGPLLDARFSRDGSQVVTASEDGTARVWQVEARTSQSVLRWHDAAVRHVEFTGDDVGRDVVVTASDDRLARLGSGSLQGPQRSPTVLAGHTRGVLSATTRAGGTRALTGSADGTTKIWTSEGGAWRVLSTIDLRLPGIPKFVTFSADGARLLTSATDTTWLLRVDEGPRVALRGHQGEVTHAAFDRSGGHVITSSEDRTARVWSATGEGQPVVLAGHEGSVYYAAFSPDGARVVTASWDGTARVWRLDGAGPPVVLHGHEKPVRSAEFSHDGTRVVTASDDRTARVWQADGRGDTVTLHGHASEVLHAVFSGADDRVISGSRDGTARVWDVDFDNPAVLRARLAGSTSVCLVPEQRATLLGEDPATAAERHQACASRASGEPRP